MAIIWILEEEVDWNKCVIFKGLLENFQKLRSLLKNITYFGGLIKIYPISQKKKKKKSTMSGIAAKQYGNDTGLR